MRLKEALLGIANARADTESARPAVWVAVQTEHPEIAAAITGIGFPETSLLTWLCESRYDGGHTPAELIGSGHSERVVELANRAQHGFYSFGTEHGTAPHAIRTRLAMPRDVAALRPLVDRAVQRLN